MSYYRVRQKEEDEEFELSNFGPSDAGGVASDPTFNIDDVTQPRRTTYSSNTFVAWLQKLLDGPQFPRDEPTQVFSNNPTLRAFERFPRLINEQFSTSKKSVAFVSYLLIWGFVNYLVLSPGLNQLQNIKMKDGTTLDVVTMNCEGDGIFWKGRNHACDIDGDACREALSGENVIIKCPALCDKGWTYSATPVGDKMIKYRQYAIGGGEYNDPEGEYVSYPYRADSFPCASAVHAGALSPFLGGCVRVSFEGARVKFESSKGHYGTGPSIDFDSFFPFSFAFKHFKPEKTFTACHDFRLLLLFLNIGFGAPVIYLAPGIFSFWTLTIMGYWTIVLSLDPPETVDLNDSYSYAELVSTGFARLLPLAFVLYAVWTTTVSTTISDPTSPLARLLCWYPMFWAGIANNITFDRLPVDRLTPQDMAQLPGSLLAEIGIILSLTISTGFQALSVWRAGKFNKYLLGYIPVIIGIILLATLPKLQLRIHHYILGILLIFTTGTRSLTAFLLQGVLLGLLISGVARWDFASIVETDYSLLRGEAGLSSHPPEGLSFANGILSWSPQIGADDERQDLVGYSLMVNDIERYVGEESSLSVADLMANNGELNDLVKASLDNEQTTNLYFRIAKASPDGDRSDYTLAGVLSWPEGDWVGPEDGVS